MIHLTVDNVNKVGLQGRTTHQETIDVLLRHQVLAVLRRHRTTIDDTHVLSNSGTHRTCHERSDLRVRLLSHIGRRRLASANSPHRLVRDHDVLPVLLLHRVHHGLQLSLAHLHRLPALSVLQQLADAQNHLHTVRQSHLRLLRDEFVALSGNRVAALAVTHKRPVDAEIYDSSIHNATHPSTWVRTVLP